MRFSATFRDKGAVETFASGIQALSRLCRRDCAVKITSDGMCFICSQATGTAAKDGESYWCGVLFPYDPTFQTHAYAGQSEEVDEILLTMSIVDFAQCFDKQNQYANTRLKLAKKDKQCVLRVEVRAMYVVHEVPITIITKPTNIYDQPAVDHPSVTLFLPPIRDMNKVLQCMKNTNCKSTTFHATDRGDLRLDSGTRYGEISVFFSNLPTVQIERDEEGGDSEDQPKSIKLPVKALQSFFYNFGFLRSRLKFSVLPDNRAEFCLEQDDLDISFVVSGALD